MYIYMLNVIFYMSDSSYNEEYVIFKSQFRLNNIHFENQ